MSPVVSKKIINAPKYAAIKGDRCPKIAIKKPINASFASGYFVNQKTKKSLKD
jgi:hypothetical protein